MNFTILTVSLAYFPVPNIILTNAEMSLNWLFLKTLLQCIGYFPNLFFSGVSIETHPRRTYRSCPLAQVYILQDLVQTHCPELDIEHFSEGQVLKSIQEPKPLRIWALCSLKQGNRGRLKAFLLTVSN